MNVQVVPLSCLREAEGLERRGDLRSAARCLLMGIGGGDDGDDSEGENCAGVLNKILKRLTDDPYGCLDVERDADAKAIKKAYRNCALTCHPDKNANKTSILFAAVQSAYALLGDDAKRRAYDARSDRRAEQTDRLRRKRADTTTTTTTTTKTTTTTRAPPPSSVPSTNSFHVPPTSAAEAKQRDFNRKFYNEYRNAAMNRRPPPPPGPKTSRDAETLLPPSKPAALRMTSKSHDTVTLEWRAGGASQAATAAASKAYELQWRLRSDSGKPPKTWDTSQQLILRTTCRKRNLRPATCYEFRVRAASVSGWSQHSDALLVVTAAAPSSQEGDRRRGDHHQKSRDDDDTLPAVPGATAPSSSCKKKAANTPAGPWHCVVCKRSNTPVADKCAICGTRKDYDWVSGKTHGQGKATPEVQFSTTTTPTKYDPRGKDAEPPAAKADYRTEQDNDDDDDDVGDGQTWAFSDSDVPSSNRRGGADDDVDIDQWMDDPATPTTTTTTKAPNACWLNTAVTSLHNVRAEPIKDAAIVGHLVADTEIEVIAETGNWIKCKYHRPYVADAASKKKKTAQGHPPNGGVGWCLRYDDDETQYVVQDSYAYPTRRRNSDESDEEAIYELRDEENRIYYFNAYTGVSMWDPPEWIDEVDEQSGAVYYTHSKTGETQWERPFDFVPIIREEVYSTAHARFVKDILSPKRSFQMRGGS